MRRLLTILIASTLVVAACGSEASVLTAPGPEPTTAPTEATTAPTGETTAPTGETTAPTEPSGTEGTVPEPTLPEPPPQALEVLQVLARYDGVTGLGTLEATVCNRGDTAIAPTVIIETAANSVTLSAPPLAPLDCADFFDTTVDLAAFGIAAPGPAEVIVMPLDEGGGGEATVATVDVPMLDATAPADQLQAYRDCLSTGHNHRNCVGYVPYHPIPDVGEVMKARGRYRSIGPAWHGEMLTYILADNELCTPRVEATMGVSGPDLITGRTVETDDYSGGYSTPFVDIHSLQSPEDWQQLIADLDNWWFGVLDGQCGNAHELTHLILGDTPMPSLLNEGLATWMEADARSGSGRPPLVECHEDHWTGWRFEEGQGDAPYQDLTEWSPDVHGIYYYYTGMCFWDYVATEYGEATVEEIIEATVAHRDGRFNGCGGLVGSVLFMRDIVTPILGVDITPITRERWGFDETFTGCEA